MSNYSKSKYFQRLLKENKKMYESAREPLKSHGPDHHLRVLKNAFTLANKMKRKIDEDVLIAACLLHDLAAYYPHESGDRYHEYDHKFAKKVLEKVNFPHDKVGNVVAAIKNHGSDPKYKDEKESVETTLLRDADKMDIFGPIGVARIIMVRTQKGDNFNDIVEDFLTNGHLERKWKSITTREAINLSRKDYEYSVDFLKRLSESIR